MLPLLLTVLLAVYVLGPDLMSRWIVSFVVPRRAVIQSKSEELARAIVWCFIPLAIAWWWARTWGKLKLCGGTRELQTIFSGFYNEAFFAQHQNDFFSALSAFWWMNWCLLWRLYLVVIAVSICMIAIIKYYGPIRRKLDGRDIFKGALAIIVLPRVSDWHVLLSEMLLPSKNLRLFVDVLTKSDNLYQGRLADKTLGPDGSLVTITMAEPSKFRRAQYLEAQKADPAVTSSRFWSRIPGEIFVIMASDITTVNVRYVQSRITSQIDPEIIRALQELLNKSKDI